MAEAFAWGPLAASSLVLGGLIALSFRVGSRLLGLVLAFGAGVLLSAVAYELVEEAYDLGQAPAPLRSAYPPARWSSTPAIVLIDHMGGEARKRSDRDGDTGSALPITLGIVLDGIPESIVLGLTLLDGSGVSVAVLAAVFLSNLPESLAATTGLKRGGWRPARIIGLVGRGRARVRARRPGGLCASSTARRHARSDSSTRSRPARS